MDTVCEMNGERKSWVRFGNHTFRPMISHRELMASIDRVAQRICEDYREKELPLFLGVLNGAFMFMAELLQRIDLTCEISFVKVASYQGTTSSGRIKELIGLNETLQGRHVIIVEDIVDTGSSIDYLIRSISEYQPASLSVATLLFKPSVYRMNYPITYRAMEIPDRFVVGFGLDYDGKGRNLNEIYELAE